MICGVAGSGKSTLAEKVAQKLGWKCVHASDILRQLQEKQIHEIDVTKTQQGKGYWESDEAMQYHHKRLKNQDMDKTVEKKLFELADQGNIVLDSWTMPWLYKKGLKIWLKVSEEERAKRLSLRDGFSIEEARKRVKEKESQTTKIFKQTYGFEFGKDLSPFQLVLDTDPLDADAVFQAVMKFIQSWQEKNP